MHSCVIIVDNVKPVNGPRMPSFNDRAPGPSLQHYRAKQCTGANIHTATHRNKTVNVNKINHMFITLVLPTKPMFKH